MKLILCLICFMSFIVYLNATYQVGDFVEDFSWQESNGNEIRTNSVYDVLDQEKVLVLYFASNG